jgi:hypothetical protein
MFSKQKKAQGPLKKGAEGAPWIVGFGFPLYPFASCLLPPQGRDVTPWLHIPVTNHFRSCPYSVAVMGRFL